MRNGFRIIDTDTHVGPNVETLQKYAGPVLQSRWSELEPYYMKASEGHQLSINPIPYRRQLGRAGTHEEGEGAGASAKLRSTVTFLYEEDPQPEVQNENAEGRLQDMDREGVDVHLIIPAPFATAVSAFDNELAIEIYSAYHRYLESYCSTDTDRLKASLFVPAADPEWSATEIKRWAGEAWVAAVTPVLPEGLPVDDPSLHPIWRAMDEADLGILHHSFFYEPPYFPGYRDVWGNIAVARTAAHPWGAQRLLAYLLLSGLLDQYPNLRIGFAECSAGWLPGWITRLEFQAWYLQRALPEREQSPLEYCQNDRVFCGIEPYEGQGIAESIVNVIGDGCLMYQSDYPHGQCLFPSTPESYLEWGDSLGDKVMTRIFSENAARYMRMT